MPYKQTNDNFYFQLNAKSKTSRKSSRACSMTFQVVVAIYNSVPTDYLGSVRTICQSNLTFREYIYFLSDIFD